MTFCSLELIDFYYSFNFSTLFQTTMPKCHKIYPNCIWHVASDWHGLNFDSALLTKVYWNYATHVVRVYVSSKSPISPNLVFTKKVIFKFTLDLKQWLVCTMFAAIILLHALTHSLKNCSLIFLHVSTLISSIILSTNTPRMMNQFIQSTSQFLHFIPTTQLTFPKNFFIFLIFLCNSNFLPQRRAFDIQKGRRPRTTDGPKEDPRPPRSRPRRRAPPTATAFPGQSRQGTAGATADG